MENSLVISENYEQGNKAMACVLLLFYHLSEEGGFIGSETVYIDRDLFNGFDYINVSVADSNSNEISEELLRTGAVVYLLCDLNDMVCEFPDEFLDSSFTKKVIDILELKGCLIIPELNSIIKLFKATESEFDYRKYYAALELIYNKYVVGTFHKLCHA